MNTDFGNVGDEVVTVQGNGTWVSRRILTVSAALPIPAKFISATEAKESINSKFITFNDMLPSLDMPEAAVFNSMAYLS